MGGREMDFIREAFEENWIVPLGPNVDGFERDLERFVNSGPEKLHKRVVALSTGTAAMHLALSQCGVGRGDEVLVQSFTFAASTNPVRYLGAEPVFVDSEPETWNLDPALLERAIEDRIRITGRKPKAIVPVYLYGMPPQMDRIMEISRRWEIPVAEDAAEGFGSRYRGRCAGTFGLFGALSFNGNKIITTSGGGALICDSEETRRRTMFLATQAREAYPYYQHEELGYNYRLSNVCAGIGRGQMLVLEDHLAHHRHVQALYGEKLKSIPGVRLHTNPSADFDSNFWLCAITLEEGAKVRRVERAYTEQVKVVVGGAAGVAHESARIHTDHEPDAEVEALRLAFEERNVETRPLWKPMHLQPYYQGCAAYLNGVSEALFRRGLCLPAGPNVSDEDVDYIVRTLSEMVYI